MLIDLCNSIERHEDGSIWGKFEYLKGRGNQVERILVEFGHPMSIAAIARKINHRLISYGQRQIEEENLLNQIIEDGRFVAIGRSGDWGLKSWTHVDTKNILKLMEEYLIIQNKPATADDIYLFVSERRPVSKNSIVFYLSKEKEHFVKVDLTTWGLAKWSDSTSLDTWNVDRIGDFVATIFKTNKAKELDYQIIKQTLMDKFSINAKQAQGLLAKNPVIKTHRGTKWNERRAVYQSNYKDMLAQAKTKFSRQKVNLRQLLDEAVHSCLEKAQDKQMFLSTLMKLMQEQYGIAESTFYNYISQADFIERIDIPNSSKKICRLKDVQSTDIRGTLRQRINDSVRDILETAPNKEMSLSEIIVQLRKEYTCPKPTLYQYIADLDYIERLDIPNSRIKICRMKNIKGKVTFPQVYSIATDGLKQSVIRAISILNETEVDLGLFSLSRDFENALKAYLIAAGANGKFQIPTKESPDKWKLAHMIDWVIKDRIITDHAVLNYSEART